MDTESLTQEKILGYVKTPYFIALCIALVVFIIYWYKDSFTAKKKKKNTEDIDDLIDSIRSKQDKLKSGRD